MVTVVQLVERQFVALVVAGSSPVGHPINYEPLAQSVEHLTFNQGVTGSIPVWLTICENKIFFCESGEIGIRTRLRI